MMDVVEFWTMVVPYLAIAFFVSLFFMILLFGLSVWFDIQLTPGGWNEWIKYRFGHDVDITKTNWDMSKNKNDSPDDNQL